MALATSTTGGSSSCSNWQAEKRTIRERTALMINNPLMSDVKFVIPKDSNSNSKNGRELIYGHKFLLSLSSPVFHAMFYGNMADTREEIPLSDCHSRSFIEFIRYLYSDEVHLTSGNVFELLYLGKKYIVPFLSESCCRFLEAELRENNVFRILEHARLFSESDLEQRCWNLLETKTSACLQSEGLLWISRDTLSSLLKRDALTLVDGECAVFKAAKRWATANCKAVSGLEPTGEKLRKVLKEVIYLIRFPMMPPRLFGDIVVPTGILTEEEASQVYLFHKQGAVAACDMKFSCLPRGPRCQSRSSDVELSRCYRYRENQTFPSSESFSSVSERLKFSTNREVYFAGIRLYAHKDEGRHYSVQLRVSRCHGLKEEVAGVRGTFTVERAPGEGGNRLGFDVLVPKPFLVSREAQFIVKVTITGNDEARASPNKGIPMKFVKCEGIEFKFEGQSRQILEILFYTVD